MKVLGAVGSNQAYGIFKSQDAEGLILGRTEIQEFSNDISLIYKEIISNAAIKWNETFDTKTNFEYLLRPVFVKLLFIFFERLYRMNLCINQLKFSHVFFSESLRVPCSLEGFDEQVKSIEFNENLIYFIKDIWDLNTVKKTTVKNSSSETEKKRNIKNNLFIYRNVNPLKNLILKQLYKVEKFLPNLNRLPALTFSNSEANFISHGLYFTHLKRLDDNWMISDKKVDWSERKLVLDDSLVSGNQTHNFFEKLGLNDQQRTKAKLKLVEFLRIMLPIDFFENYESNIKNASARLVGFKRKKLLMSCSLNHSKPIFLAAFAKHLGFKIINVQHGGYYGYIKDFSVAIEIEWPLNDIFISWGWTSPEIEYKSHLLIKPMPSPWLSERKLYWQGFNFFGEREYDVLWLPQSMRPFTYSPQGASSIRPDVINDFSFVMQTLLKRFIQNQISVHCKPYDELSLKLMTSSYEKVKKKTNFKISEDLHKGLDHYIVSTSSLIVWDQIGTGFLECVACGIPTIVILYLDYSEFEDRFKSDLDELMSLGIVHLKIESFIDEINNFKKDPACWMNRLETSEFFIDFVSRYAKSDLGWKREWKSFFRNL